jgi:hypothetical protein
MHTRSSRPAAPRALRRAGLLLVLAGPLAACASMPRAVRVGGSDGGDAGTPPATFVKTTSESRTTRILDVREGMTKPQLWRAATDLLGQKHTIDVRDQQAGFVMTTWESSLLREGVPDSRYRTRVVLRFVGDDWKQLQLRMDAQWRRGDEWDFGVDSTLMERTVAEVRERIGKREGAAPPTPPASAGARAPASRLSPRPSDRSRPSGR